MTQLSKVYDSSTGKFRKTCVNPNCNEPFWGRKDQQYCGRRCKNQVNNAKWRAENPTLKETERLIRLNYRILVGLIKAHGVNKWLNKTILNNTGFNGKLYHSFSEKILKDSTACKVLQIFDLQLYVSTTQILINKPI
jgi:hypothetical protein